MRETPEERLARDEREAAISYRFMQKHPTLVQSKEMAHALADFLKAENLQWTVDSLEQAYETLHLTLKHDESEPSKYVEEKPEQPFPWPSPLTIQIIRDMPREDYRKFMKDQRFIDQIDAMNIRSSRSGR